jgi:hypothetical protein
MSSRCNAYTGNTVPTCFCEYHLYSSFDDNIVPQNSVLLKAGLE